MLLVLVSVTVFFDDAADEGRWGDGDDLSHHVACDTCIG